MRCQSIRLQNRRTVDAVPESVAMSLPSRVELLLTTLAFAGLSAPGVCAEDPRVLLQRYKCYICHADRETKTGPAYADVAAHYRGDPNAVAALTAAVKQGDHGAGPWPMPPHPEVSAADARTMVRYILSLRE
jgi:cytochrome c551/c552